MRRIRIRHRPLFSPRSFSEPEVRAKKAPAPCSGGKGISRGEISRPGKPGTNPAQGGRAGSHARSGRKDRFRELVKANPDLALTMLGSMSIHLKHLVQMIDDLKFKQIECRLANWLARNAIHEGEQSIVDLPMSKKLLASQLGVTSETLSRAFSRFRREDILNVDGRHITIKDTDALSKYLDG